MNEHIRYRYTKKSLSRKEACERHRAMVAQAKAELEEAEKNFRWACRQPLETEIEVQEEVRPGEPGFIDLPDHFDERRYLGNVRWINLPPTDQPDTASIFPSISGAPAPPDPASS